jgi:hypothetical protein
MNDTIWVNNQGVEIAFPNLIDAPDQYKSPGE